MSLRTPSAVHDAAQDWFADRYQAIFVSRNRWLVTAITALGLALLQALALVCLLPLKTSIPFLVKEEVSGAVTTLSPIGGNPSVTYEESVRKYFLAKYVIARETYDTADLAENYRAVDLMSNPEVTRAFNQSISDSNPHSPIAVYGPHARRTIRIKSISFLNDHLAQARLTATEHKGAGSETSNEWIALAEFRFGAAPALEAERLINPLGFVVTSYRIDQEVVP